MKGNPQVIDALNRALTIELTAINQYFCQAKMNQNWGFLHLYKKHYEESLGEMKHAEKLIERILFLEGVPEIARYDVIKVGTDVKEQFTYDLALEMNGVKTYNQAIELCTTLKDNGTRELRLHVTADVEFQVLHLGGGVEEQDALDQLLGVLHLVDRLLLDVVAERVVAPLVAHLRVQEVLVDGRELLTQRHVQLGNDLRGPFHVAPR